jgi:two-component system chemotaxis response regulator CheB
MNPGEPALTSGAIEASPDEERVVQRDLVVVGASAGGVEALQRFVAGLPPELPAAVLVVLHLMQKGVSVLDSILERAGPLPVKQPVDGERPERGHIYVAPPNTHLLLRGGRIHLSDGPRENGHRPAVDPLFRSAARAFGPRTIGVVLSGTLDDGTDGLRLIKELGGATIVQDPDDATYGDMPRSAIEWVEPDVIAPVDEIGAALYRLIDSPLEGVHRAWVADPATQPIDQIEVELGHGPPDGRPSLLTCPDCGGVLVEHEHNGIVRFACQVGHAYSPESLVEEQGSALESALWSAMRTLEERADLLRRMSRRAERSGAESTQERLAARASHVADEANTIRNTILRLRGVENGAVPDSA